MSLKPDTDELEEQILKALNIQGGPEVRRLVATSLFGDHAKDSAVVEARADGKRVSQPAMSTIDLDSWRAKAERSEKLVEALVAKVEMLACAVGACPNCWGEDPQCADCGGEGAPGVFLPDRVCFKTYVEPVLRTLLDERAAAPSHPLTTPGRVQRHPHQEQDPILHNGHLNQTPSKYRR